MKRGLSSKGNYKFLNSFSVSDEIDIQIEELLIDTHSDPYYSVFENDKSRVIPSGNYDLYHSGRTQYWDLKTEHQGGFFRRCCKSLIRCFSKKKNMNQITKLEMIEMKKRAYLNDYAYEYPQTKVPKIITRIQKKISSTIPVFLPESDGFLYWQFLNCLFILYFFFEIPFIMFFRGAFLTPQHAIDKEITETINLILISGIAIFFIDIFVCFNTAVYKQGEVMILRKINVDRAIIAKTYLRSNFWLDLVSFLCLNFQLFNPLNPMSLIFLLIFYLLVYINVLFYLKINQIISIQSKIQQLLQLRRRKLAIYSLIQLLLWLIFLCHIFACIFYGIGYYEYIVKKNEKSWLQPFVDQQLNIPEQYLEAFYWSVTTMISVGYGDITPKNPPEILMTVFAMFISCIVFAYSVNAIWEIIREYNETRFKFQKNVTAINAFMRDHNINRKLKSQIAVYLNHLWESQKRRDFESEQIMIKKLAPTLREELLFDSFGLFLQKTMFFSENFSIEFLKELAEDIEQVRFSEGEIIFNQYDESDDFSIYFVLSGQVELYLDTPKPIFLAFLKENQSFGLKGFVQGFGRTSSAKCKTYSTIYKLSRHKFLARLESFVHSKEKEIFHRIRDDVIFKDNYEKLYLRCFICESENHLANLCDKTHYISKKELVIKNYTSQVNDQVKEYNRPKPLFKRFSALKKLQQVQRDALYIQRSTSIDLVSDYEEKDENSSSESDSRKSEEEVFPQRQTGYFKSISTEKEKQRDKISLTELDKPQIIQEEKFSIQNEHNSIQSIQMLGQSFNNAIEIEEKKDEIVDPLQQSCQLDPHVVSLKERGFSTVSHDDFIFKAPRLTSNEKKAGKNKKVEKNTTFAQPIKKRRSVDNLSQIPESPKINFLRKKNNSGNNDIFDELRQIIMKQQSGSVLKRSDAGQKEEPIQNNVNPDGYESEFSIDGMQNYQNYFADWNPQQIVGQVKRHLKSIRRLVLYKRQLIEQQRQ